jgi:hypothetical protein
MLSDVPVDNDTKLNAEVIINGTKSVIVSKRQQFPMIIVEENGSLLTEEDQDTGGSILNPNNNRSLKTGESSGNKSLASSNLTDITSFELTLHPSNETALFKKFLGNDTSNWVDNTGAIKSNGTKTNASDDGLKYSEGNYF